MECLSYLYSMEGKDILVTENSCFKVVRKENKIQIIKKGIDPKTVAPDGTLLFTEEELKTPWIADMTKDKLWRTLPIEEMDDAFWMIEEEVLSVSHLMATTGE